MPNRILRESICVSPSLDNICAQAETLFYRLLTAADDYGIFDARPKVVKGRCFPLKDYNPAEIAKWLGDIEKAGMIYRYQANGGFYGKFVNWEEHNKIRSKKSKFPPPPADICKHLQADENICASRARESESESESNEEEMLNEPASDEAPDVRTCDICGEDWAIKWMVIADDQTAPAEGIVNKTQCICPDCKAGHVCDWCGEYVAEPLEKGGEIYCNRHCFFMSNHTEADFV